ncbi:FAD-dependent oxidoreductase domain-containing protein 1 [Uranotaenia lowii]|uniref:FAD-dependent oxidoreductase domain-containing protein 1 n=1 Tax=Uranotaenia lowii TaxID=190385 RepID=UPI002479EF27|nr:FAD-dependent oxidoreductase domain-containing protein 1 [Uranotaenia lowii]XP_055614397.1 FAD-dependent oxidoreductase domain-containing protein 1 [Uranotaenia lowii]XP_055614398.1 FAD-dependent oxidoreductase domain-containing protein 1 [Uranotaenia lowii]XP_055614399.1 FAD-dependent oxidoreductase domain-containing protein 1 [Uranotaenia lowii]
MLLKLSRKALEVQKFPRELTCAIRQLSSDSGDKDKNRGPVKPSDVAANRENPVSRTLKILGNDMGKVKNFITPNFIKAKSKSTEDVDSYLEKYRREDFQSHCDVLIIGGGGVGSSIAYWLKKRARDGLNVVVLEKDSTYKEASTCLSVGGLRQQFSVVENIQMSLYGADFMRKAKEHLGEDVDVNFTPYGYLMLASEKGAEQLQENSKLQNMLGAKNEILTATRLKERFPWMNTDGIALGCHGLEKEGWFDPWALLSGFKSQAIKYGAHFVEAEFVNFSFKSHPDILVNDPNVTEYEGLDRAYIKMKNGEIRDIKFSLAIIAAGAQSGNVAKAARIGTGPGILTVPLPVEPRKRYVYVFQCQGDNGPGINTPLTIDPTGTYFRRDGLGGNYLGGKSPLPDEEPSVDNLDVDHTFFDQHVWPNLAQLVPSFEAIKVKNAWAGYYEYNTFDENGIVGPHPYYNNLYIATGFSGHGIQQTPAVGRAISEMIIDGEFRTIDLTRFGFDRILIDQPLFEANIV